MIAPHYAHRQGVNYDERNGDWLQLPEYPLPARWQEPSCSLLILFPDTYPSTAPIGFYLNRSLAFKDGGRDPHLTGRALDGAPELLDLGWFWYCVTIPGWRPSANYREPDNLFSFLALVRETLTND